MPVAPRPRARAPIHYMVIPRTDSIEEHAVRAGAPADRWRQHVCDDLATAGEVRVISRKTHAHFGVQVGIVGREFYAEANIHDRRDDALFVHRVMPLARRPAGTPFVRAGALQLLETQSASSAPRVDRVVDLFTASADAPTE